MRNFFLSVSFIVSVKVRIFPLNMHDIIIYVARWWEKYLSKRSLIKHTCSWHDKLIALFSIGLKSGERAGMLNVSKAYLAFLLFCTRHPSSRILLPFGILHQLKVSWKCILMKSENMSALVLPTFTQSNTFLMCYCHNEICCSSSRAHVKSFSSAVRV